MKPILNTAEASELLCCEPSTTRELARSGRLKGVKFGHDWVFPLSLLIEAVTQMAEEPNPPKGGGASPPIALFQTRAENAFSAFSRRSRPRPDLSAFSLAGAVVGGTA